MDWGLAQDDDEGFQVLPLPVQQNSSRLEIERENSEPWWKAPRRAPSYGHERLEQGQRSSQSRAHDELSTPEAGASSSSRRFRRDESGDMESPPARPSRSSEHGQSSQRPSSAGVVPDGASFLGVERSILMLSEQDSNVIVQDAQGNDLVLTPGAEHLGFEVSLAGGTFSWRTATGEPMYVKVSWQNLEEEQKPPETNWIVANRSSDGRTVSWMCYRQPSVAPRDAPSAPLPPEATVAGATKATLAGAATLRLESAPSPLLVKDGIGSDEVAIARGSERTFPARLDPTGSLSWRCDQEQGQITPNVIGDVRWVTAKRSSDGHEATFQFYTASRTPTPPAGALEARREIADAASLPLGQRAEAGERQQRARDKEEDDQGSSEAMLPKPSRKCGKCTGSVPCFRLPVVSGIVLIAACLAFTVLMYPSGIEVETDFDTFMEANSGVNDQWNAFNAALEKRATTRRLEAARQRGRRLDIVIDNTILHHIVSFNLIYSAKGGGNVMNRHVLHDIKAFEQRLQSLPKWRRLCQELTSSGMRELCDPGVSIVNYLYPASRTPKGPFNQQAVMLYNLSGDGTEALPLETLSYLTEKTENTEVIFPKDFPGRGGSSMVRSRFEFNMVCCNRWLSVRERRPIVAQLEQDYEDFIKEELYPELLSMYEDEGKSFELNWYGDYIEEHEVWIALMSDAKLAIGSASFIFFYLTLHTRSPLLSFSAVFLTLLAIPTAFVTAARVGGVNRITGASMLSLFLIIGLGADDALVFASFWNRSAADVGKANYAERVAYVYRHAAMAALVTSVTTAASFFANLASVLSALREFGFFMGMCVMWAYIYILIGFPGALVLNERIADRCGCCRRFVWSILTGAIDSAKDRGSKGEKTKNWLANPWRAGISYTLKYGLIPYQRSVLAVSLVVPAVMLVWTVSEVKVDGEMPELFPKDHNQHSISDIKDAFEPMATHYPPMSFNLCLPEKESPSRWQAEDCSLYWCFIPGTAMIDWHGFNEEGAANASCACRTSQDLNTASCSVKTVPGQTLQSKVQVRFVGLELSDLDKGFFESDVWHEHLKAAVSNFHERSIRSVLNGYASSVNELSRVVQEHWETGFVHVKPFVQAPTATLGHLSTVLGDRACDMDQVCYCGSPGCMLQGEGHTYDETAPQKWMTLEIPRSRRMRAVADHHTEIDREKLGLGPGYNLAVPSWSPSRPSVPMPRGRRLVDGAADVAFVWGILVTESSSSKLGKPEDEELWDPDPSFVPASTTAQRQLLNSCRYVEEHEIELSIARRHCWVEEFRDWLRLQTPAELYPVRVHLFHELLQRWSVTTLMPSGLPVREYMWINENEELYATYVIFELTLPYASTTASRALEEKNKWDKAARELQGLAPPDADGMFHASRLWIRAEAEQAIIDGTVNTLVLSIACGFLGALAFTRNIIIALYLIISVAGVTVSLAFFMVVIMSWTLGVVEVLGLIIFVGYSITYSLHIAHRYDDYQWEHADERPRRRREGAVKEALQSMAGAVVGSAITTLGSSFFLFFTVLVIFYKMASVLFAVTFFAAVFALVALPSALLVAGPLGLCGFGCIFRRFTRKAFAFQALDEDDESVGSGDAEGQLIFIAHQAPPPPVLDARALRISGVEGATGIVPGSGGPPSHLLPPRSPSLRPSRPSFGSTGLLTDVSAVSLPAGSGQAAPTSTGQRKPAPPPLLTLSGQPGGSRPDGQAMGSGDPAVQIASPTPKSSPERPAAMAGIMSPSKNSRIPPASSIATKRMHFYE